MQQNIQTLAKNWLWLIMTVIIVNASGLFSPILNSNDAYFYAVIAKNMVLSHNWLDLYYNGQDWLDKPHFPFWLTAVSFKILGINTFAYVLPGFLFHLLGAYYTYRLAKHFYSHEVGLIAALIYVTSLHLLLSAVDVRAEAYLIGEIMPACYYWLIYDQNQCCAEANIIDNENSFFLRISSVKALFLASIFTACAMMTKGLFVVVTIFSGITATWLYKEYIVASEQKKWPNRLIYSLRGFRQLYSLKWLAAYLLCLIFILPELIALYLQFDAHPDKIVFGQTHVSGLTWYFWGSQFGRFFNNGPIVNRHGNPLFFVHTYLWAFLPWSLVFIVANYSLIRNWRTNNMRVRDVYLLASFWLTFIMFSATKFQLDHYTNIIMPFAAIICARYLYTSHDLAKLNRFQTGLSVLLLILTIGLSIFLFRNSITTAIILVPLVVLLYIWQKPELGHLEQTLIYPSLSICAVFLFLILVNENIYEKYDLGYNVAHITNEHKLTQVYIYEVNGVINSLRFHALNPVSEISDKKSIANLHHSYLLIKTNVDKPLPLNAQILGEYLWLPMEKFIPSLFSPQVLQTDLQHIHLIYLP